MELGKGGVVFAIPWVQAQVQVEEEMLEYWNISNRYIVDNVNFGLGVGDVEGRLRQK